MTIPLTPSTRELLDSVDALSANALRRKNDFGIIIEMATLNGALQTLDDLAFVAKFIVKTHGIMKRIGPGGGGYDTLSSEFSAQVENATTLTRTLISPAPPGVQQEFERTYFSMSREGLHNLLALFHDLAWYKNWLIDHPQR